MVRSLPNVKLLSTLLADGFSNSLSRRGYAVAAAQGVVSSVASSGAKSGHMTMKPVEQPVPTTERVPWVPDSVTGFYRPENCSNEIDVAKLRALLLKNNKN